MKNSEILIGRWGKIISGEKAGCFVFIVDDAADTGGFFIYKSPNMSLDSSFNSWVQSRKELTRFFEFAKWEIEWLEHPDISASSQRRQTNFKLYHYPKVPGGTTEIALI